MGRSCHIGTVGHVVGRACEQQLCDRQDALVSPSCGVEVSNHAIMCVDTAFVCACMCARVCPAGQSGRLVVDAGHPVHHVQVLALPVHLVLLLPHHGLPHEPVHAQEDAPQHTTQGREVGGSAGLEQGWIISGLPRLGSIRHPGIHHSTPRKV
jgi:hypothetical protein